MPRRRRSAAANQNTGEAGGWCPRCRAEGKTCRSCRQRWTRAWKLVKEQGRTIDETARLMRLPTKRVQLFLALEADRREVRRHHLDSIPTERLRTFIDEEFRRDPELNHAELAHRLGMTESDLLHQFGYRPPKRSNKARGQRVHITTASRTVIALGRAPNELEGC